MQGKQIDLDLLIKRNELTPAVGNAKVNARGDELGAGGKIIRKREEVVNEYYKGSAPVVSEQSQRASTPKQPEQKAKQPEVKLSETEKVAMEEFDDGWEENDEGDFVPKNTTTRRR